MLPVTSKMQNQQWVVSLDLFFLSMIRVFCRPDLFKKQFKGLYFSKFISNDAFN